MKATSDDALAPKNLIVDSKKMKRRVSAVIFVFKRKICADLCGAFGGARALSICPRQTCSSVYVEKIYKFIARSRPLSDGAWSIV